MKILFLGYAVDLKSANELSGASVAGNKMQVSVLKNLSKYSDIELSCITIYPIAAFPHDKNLWIGEKKIKITETLWADRISFLNLPIIKQLQQTINVYRRAKKYADKDTLILAFNLFPQVGLPLMWLKSKFGCKTYSLLADLPIDDNVSSKNPIRRFFRKIFDNITAKALKTCDRLIVLNRRAAEIYAPGTKYIVVEGGIESDTLPVDTPVPYSKRSKKIIYSGALTEYSGVLNLIEAMKYVKDPDAVLEVYGGGYLKDQIAEMAEKMKNVKYCGRVDNKTMLDIQRNAYVLVNPRPVNDRISQVTFPSKMFEYMTSGTAVLSTELNGLTEEYLKNIYHTENNSPELLAEEINNILVESYDLPEKKANDAKNFILNNKTWEKQAEKIHDFMREKNV